METLEKLQRRIRTSEELGSVVRTMKALAAVSIRQYERAVESLAEYRRTVEMGLQIVLRESPEITARLAEAPRRRAGVVIFGSDQGMCGPLNDRVAAHALGLLDHLGIAAGDRVVLAVGARVASRLAEAGQPVEREVRLPGSIPAITGRVQEVLLDVDRWQEGGRVDQVILVFARHLSRSTFRPEAEHLLPIDRRWLAELERQPWPSRGQPIITMETATLFSSLIRQYLFIGVYRAFAESLASENASRLASMRRAEDNIAERLDELRRDFHQQRQAAITDELLDIVSAYEMLDVGDAPDEDRA